MVTTSYPSRRSHLLAVILLVVLSSLSSLAAAQDADSTPPAGLQGSSETTTPSLLDTTAPMIPQPLDHVIPAADVGGASVTFVLPIATDDVDGDVPVTCDWHPGAVFPLGTTTVTCSARDGAGNAATISFLVLVVDQTPPVLSLPMDVYAVAPGVDGAVVDFVMPSAMDNVDGFITAACDQVPGSFFPIGVTTVTCWATDSSGNTSSAVAFSVIVDGPPLPVATEPPPPPPPVPTEVPATEAPTPAPMPSETVTPDPTSTSPAGSDPAEPTATATELSATVTPSIPEPTATAAPAATEDPVETVPAALSLPWPPPANLSIDPPGGPLNGIDAIWGYEDFPVSQEFGHTEFSISHFSWYSYGIAYGLDGYEHPGLDVGMPAGTWLYSPVEGTVEIAGGVRAYTYYGNWEPHVGQLLIVTDAGDEIVLGHMGRIAVNEGDRVSVGQFVGTSGGYNGDHLHLEVREAQQGGWFLAVDPRTSAIVDSLAAAARESETPEALADTTN